MTNIISMTTMCADVFVESGKMLAGGEALNFAANACKFPDVKVSIMGAIGDDDCGREVLRSIEGKPVDISDIHIIKGGKTASNHIYLTENGDRYFMENSWDGGVDETFSMSESDRKAVCGSDIVYMTCYCHSYKDVVSLKDRSDFKLAVDFDVRRDFDEIEKLLLDIDFFFISGSEDILPVFEKWSEKYDCIFNVTLAENGSVTYHKGRKHSCKAVPVSEVIDTTGCGDSYHAAFLCSYAAEGDIQKAMACGSASASETLSHIGGFKY